MEERFCYWVNPTSGPIQIGTQVGYILSAVEENQKGHSPMKGNPAKLQAPWVWGPTLEDAEAIAQRMNEKLGLSERDVAEIIASSMRA